MPEVSYRPGCKNISVRAKHQPTDDKQQLTVYEQQLQAWNVAGTCTITLVDTNRQFIRQSRLFVDEKMFIR